MDISNLTYNELVILERDIIERKKELKRTEYESLAHGVMHAIDAIMNAGFKDTVCFYDYDGDAWVWNDLMAKISEEYTRKLREDY